MVSNRVVWTTFTVDVNIRSVCLRFSSVSPNRFARRIYGAYNTCCNVCCGLQLVACFRAKFSKRVFKLMLARWRSKPIKYRVRERQSQSDIKASVWNLILVLTLVLELGGLSSSAVRTPAGVKYKTKVIILRLSRKSWIRFFCSSCPTLKRESLSSQKL